MDNILDLTINEKDSISKFAIDIACLDKVYAEINDINYFEILGVEKAEIRHSNFLKWLFDPSSLSGMGDKLLKRLLLFCSENNDRNPNTKNSLDAVKIELMELGDVIVKREETIGKSKNRIDILINSKKYHFCICIENKIDSGESNNQLSKYYNYVEDNFSKEDFDNRYYVLLSPTGNEAEKKEDQENWIPLGYEDLRNWIDSLTKAYKESIPEKSYNFICDYTKVLEKKVIEGGEFKKTCEGIYKDHVGAFSVFEKYRNIKTDGSEEDDEYNLYKKHKEAIDLVLDNRTKLTEKIKLRLIEELRNNGQDVQYDSKRAPAYIKVPIEAANNINIVDHTKKDDISSDFIYYELYYGPTKKRYYIMLKCMGKNMPDNFDTKKYGKEIKGDGTTKLKTITIKDNGLKGYIEKLEKENKEPSKDDEFIKSFCKEVIKTIKSKEAKEEWNKIINALL